MSTQSTVTLQNIADILKGFGDVKPQLNTGGNQNFPFLAAATDVMDAICAVAFPHKWNELNLPPLFINSLQQDYVVLNSDGSSITNLSWLERGVAIDINNTAQPKPFRYVEVGRQLPQQTGTWFNYGVQNPIFLVNWFPNQTLYYGVWGANNTGNSTFGNNPGPGSVYTGPVGCSVTNASWAANQITFTLNYIPNGAQAGNVLVVTGALPSGYSGSFTIVSVSGLNVVVTSTTNPGTFQAGGLVGINAAATTPTSMPNNPITQIKDANGNLLVLTTFGTEGTTAPLAGVNATPGTTVFGTGATTVWTVADPNGSGFRILPVPSSSGNQWMVNLVGQKKPVRFKNMQQTLDPLPDEYESHFRMGVLAQLYRYSPLAAERAKFQDNWNMWLRSLQELRIRQDRELEENLFTLDRGIFGRRSNPRSQSGWPGPANPFFPG